MALVVRPATEALMPAVKAMNSRLRAAGSHWGFYDRVHSEWLPDDGGPAVRAHWLLVEEPVDTVRGGYVLKRQPACLAGEMIELGNVQGPVSEGLVNPRFALAGPLLMKDALRRSPLQIGWGTSDRKVAMLERGGWTVARVPVMIRTGDAAALVRAVGAARGGTPGRLLALAAPLAPLAGGAAVLAAKMAAGEGPGPARARPVEALGPEADRIWAAARGHDLLAAERTAALMARLLAGRPFPGVSPYLVEAGGEAIGWVAARVEQLAGHRRLGNARVVTIADALALPGREAEVAIAATDALLAERPALLAASFTHARWQQAFAAAGFTRLRPSRALLFSPALTARLGPAAARAPDCHFGLLDGDGPRMF